MKVCADCGLRIRSHDKTVARCRLCYLKSGAHAVVSRKGGLAKRGTACAANFAEAHPRWRGGSVWWRGFAWTRQKRLARERDGNACVKCGVSGTERKLNVHHVKRAKDTGGVWDNSLANLRTLCCSCHAKADGLGGYVPSKVVCRMCGVSFIAGAGNASLCSVECRRARWRERYHATRRGLPPGTPPENAAH